MVLRGIQKDNDHLFKGINLLLEKAGIQDSKGIKEIMQEIIPEYTPDYKISGILR